MGINAAGGKSIVADVLMIRRLHQLDQASGRKAAGSRAGCPSRALVVLPYLSIVAEKATHLTALLHGVHWGVYSYMGNQEGVPLSHKVTALACRASELGVAMSRKFVPHLA